MAYQDYVFDSKHMKDYSEYQNRYAETIRESDKVLISKIDQASKELGTSDRKIKIIDIGCSTGNLLLHLKRLSKDYELHGADLAPEVISSCKSNPVLEGVQFHELNMLNLEESKLLKEFDIVVLNAALMFFTNEEFAQAIKQVSTLLGDKGKILIFDYLNPYEQEVEIVETTTDHPNGLKFYFRSYKIVKECLHKLGVSKFTFEPFHIPFDIGNAEQYDNNRSYSVNTTSNKRLSFRGILNQPWCFLEIVK